MRVRRDMARLAALLAVLGGFVLVGAAPAAADGADKVSIHVPSSFTAGGSAGSVTVGVSKRSRGCAVVSTGLRMRLAGLSPSQVQVQVATHGQWQQVGLSGGDGGLVATGHSSPDRPVLCERKSVSVRYRVTFLAGVPAGTLTVVGEATAIGGGAIERATDTAKVVGRKGASASPTRSATPSPTPEETLAAVPPVQSTPTETAPAAPSPAAGEGGGGLGSAAMLFGIALVGIGIALLVVLLRRGRGGRDKSVDGGGTGPIGPGGGGYPAGPYGVPPGGAPAPTMYGVPPGGAPAPTMYGVPPGGAPAPTMYGAPPGGAGTAPTAYGPPAGGFAPAAGDATVIMPKSGADSTAIMPRLPDGPA